MQDLWQPLFAGAVPTPLALLILLLQQLPEEQLMNENKTTWEEQDSKCPSGFHSPSRHMLTCMHGGIQLSAAPAAGRC